MPTKKCEKCGEEIQNLKYKKHVESCEGVSAMPTVEVPKKKVEDKVPEGVSKEVAALISAAKQAQKVRLEAPDAVFSEDSTDKHMALRKVHCPESLGDNAEWECAFGHHNKRLDGYAAQGYEPILDGKGNIIRDDQGNPMMRIPKTIYRRMKEVYQRESSSRLGQVTRDAKEKSTASGAEFSGGDAMHEEELTIKRTIG